MCIPPGPPHLPTKERPLHVLLGGRTVGVHNPVCSSCECISMHFKRYIEVECREKAEHRAIFRRAHIFCHRYEGGMAGYGITPSHSIQRLVG